jgi:hypothetical protein
MIEWFPKDDDILPAKLNRAKVKWAEIKEARESFTMQSSLASVLSNDPETKMKQIEKLMQMQVINPYQQAQLLEIPDINQAYSVATASYDYCLKIIENAIEKKDYAFGQWVNLAQLLDVTVTTLCQLSAEDEDPEIISNLAGLLTKVLGDINTKDGIQNPQMPPPPPENVQNMAMNGAQVVAFKDVAESIHAGRMPAEVGGAIIAAGFPTVSEDQIAVITGQPLPPIEGEQGLPPDAAPEVV